MDDISKDSSKVNYYIYTANKALEAHKEFLDAWSEFLEKEARGGPDDESKWK